MFRGSAARVRPAPDGTVRFRTVRVGLLEPEGMFDS